ncbi:MAG TPA: hypothetical protein VMS41_03720, partial [Gaiellaceae bacterium]|nr:hypothetical protein [Gaiellaceae bacterium]
WSALVLAVVGDLAIAFRVVRRPLAAGLFALSAVVALAVFVGALEEWAGWLAHTDSPFAGFHLDHFAIELTLLAGAVAARSVFRFPLLVLVSTGAAWFFVTDLLSNGGNWSAIVTLFFGLVAMLVGLGADRVYGFWVQVVAGLTIGGALLTFWHSSDFDWIMIAIASVLYVLLGSGIGRSSYTVLGAFGLFLVTSHFVFKWFLPFRISFFSEESETTKPWAAALSYAVYGLFLMLLGMWIARRRGAAVAV